MIKMMKTDAGYVPVISAPEVLGVIDDVRTLRDALSGMLECVLFNSDLTQCTPNKHLYIVANIVNTLTKDIERGIKEGDVR